MRCVYRCKKHPCCGASRVDPPVGRRPLPNPPRRKDAEREPLSCTRCDPILETPITRPAPCRRQQSSPRPLSSAALSSAAFTGGARGGSVANEHDQFLVRCHEKPPALAYLNAYAVACSLRPLQNTATDLRRHVPDVGSGQKERAWRSSPRSRCIHASCTTQPNAPQPVETIVTL